MKMITLKVLDDSQKEELLERIENGEKYVELSEEYGYSISTIATFARQNGKRRHNEKNFLDEETKEILKSFFYPERTKSFENIKELTGISLYNIRRYYLENGKREMKKVPKENKEEHN
jgi:hypothetical protein